MRWPHHEIIDTWERPGGGHVLVILVRHPRMASHVYLQHTDAQGHAVREMAFPATALRQLAKACARAADLTVGAEPKGAEKRAVQEAAGLTTGRTGR